MQTDALIQHAMKGLSSLHEEKIPAEKEAAHFHRTLADLLHDGFYLLLLLKNSYVPADSVNFPVQIRRLLDEFECSAKRINAVPEDIHATKYAFCAAVDELILSSEMPIREIWERAPLQLVLFGDQLAGENFYQEMERVRHRGRSSVQALEVFYTCLLIGFKGKYAFESEEKLNYLKASLDKEITHLKGRRAQFSPHWKSPDSIKHMVKANIPAWVICAALGALGIATYAGLSWLLAQQTNDILANYVEVIKLAPKVANITITLP